MGGKAQRDGWYTWLCQNFQEDTIVHNAVFQLTIPCCIMKTYVIKSQSLQNRNLSFSALKFYGGRTPKIRNRNFHAHVRILHLENFSAIPPINSDNISQNTLIF